MSWPRGWDINMADEANKVLPENKKGIDIILRSIPKLSLTLIGMSYERKKNAQL